MKKKKMALVILKKRKKIQVHGSIVSQWNQKDSLLTMWGEAHHRPEKVDTIDKNQD